MSSEGQTEPPISLFGQPANLTESFHRVGSLLPDDQEVMTVDPQLTVGDALRIMSEHHFSQLPIVAHGEVLGVFSYRSFAEGVRQLSPDPRVNVLDVEVIELKERIPFAKPGDPVDSLLTALSEFDAVLIGSSDVLVGLATPMDVVTYLYEIANHFVLLQEIELALRVVIHACLPEQLEREAIFRRALRHYPVDRIPLEVADLTFMDYHSVISFAETWPSFAPMLGSNRALATAKLRPLPELRNDIFHFRRQITVEDHQTLSRTRMWLLDRLTMAKLRRATDDD
jgi:CBS domain-containing protein